MNRMIAKADTTKPTAAALTPKEREYIGIEGTITPKPTATKNEAMIKVLTSVGSKRQVSNALTELFARSIFLRFFIIFVGSERYLF